MIKLSPRLQVIADYVDEDAHVVDVGCDHALLDIYLVQAKKDIKVIASDINANALANAKKNIKRYHLNQEITTVLSNGLQSVETDTIDTVIMSGMGAHTAVGVLYFDLRKLKNITTIIIQSNNDLDFLREKVTKIGYYIDNETMIKDSNIIYTVVVFKKGHKFYSKKELYFGPILLKNKSDLFLEKNRLDLEKFEKFYPMIPKGRVHHRMITSWKIRNIKKILNT